MLNILKRVVGVIAVLLVSGLASAQTPIAVTAPTLGKIYDDNELRGDQQFRGQLVRVTGVVTDIARTISDTPYISLSGWTELNLLGLVFREEGIDLRQGSDRGVTCQLASAAVGDATQLEIGQNVTLEGVVDGLSINVQMSRCRVVVEAIADGATATVSGLDRSGSSCPSGQELRGERYDATRIKSQGCVGPDSERNYRRQGHWEYFHPNGQKSGEGSYVDGNQGGETGSTGILIDGRDGPWTLWHENGQKSQEATYRDGKEDGLMTGWHANGQKSLEGTFRDGKAEGLATQWHENGQKSREDTYRDGELTSFTEWDESGTQTSR